MSTKRRGGKRESTQELLRYGTVALIVTLAFFAAYSYALGKMTSPQVATDYGVGGAASSPGGSPVPAANVSTPEAGRGVAGGLPAGGG